MVSFSSHRVTKLPLGSWKWWHLHFPHGYPTVNGPGICEVTRSNGGYESVRKWKRLWILTVEATSTDWLRILIHGSHVARWKQHFRVQFTWPLATMGIPFMLSNRPSLVDTSLPPEMEMMREIGLVKRHNAAGSDGLSPCIFKNGFEMLRL